MTLEEAVEFLLRGRAFHIMCPHCHGVGKLARVSFSVHLYSSGHANSPVSCGFCHGTGGIATTAYETACALLGLDPKPFDLDHHLETSLGILHWELSSKDTI